MAQMNFVTTTSACIGLGIALVAATSAWSAESPKDVLAKFGMLGKWAYNCSEPASADNFHSIFEGQSNGEVKRTYRNAPDRVYNVYRVVRAKIQDDNTLWIELFGKDKSEHVTNQVELKGNKYRVLRSDIVNGPALINDDGFTGASAKLLGDKKIAGQAPPWSEKCQ